jgi:Peptidase family M28/Anti-sigma-28 factor, FlgM
LLDSRLYRAAFLPLLPVLLVAMFSIQGRPEPVLTRLAPDAFSHGRAAAAARAVARLSPNRTPGSAGDRDAAAFVTERFGAIEPGRVSVQKFSGSYRGRTVEMRNVVLILPGLSDRRLVILAARDSALSPGANSSAAGTGALVELASALGGASHRRTLVLVSTDGGSAAAAGARAFAQRFPGASRTDAAIVLEKPAVAEGAPPYAVPWADGHRSSSLQLVQSAKAALREEVGRDPEIEGFAGHLLRLATGLALQQQGPLIEAGIPAITLTSDGELPPTRAEDRLDALSPTKLGQFGRAALSLVLALDAERKRLDHGPGAFVTIGGNVIPGWALALLAAALLVPALLVAIDGVARARRRKAPVAAWVRWTILGAVPFLAALFTAYLLELAGLIPDTGFPYDPQRYPVDGAAVGSLLLVVLAFWTARRAIHAWQPPRTLPSDSRGRTAAIGLVVALTAALVWFVNPYVALLLVPGVDLWMLASAPGSVGSSGRRWGMVALGLAPLVIAAAYAALVLDSRLATPWHLLLLVTSGQIAPLMAMTGCLLAGAVVRVGAVIRVGGSGVADPREPARHAVPPPRHPVSPEPIGSARVRELRARIADGTYVVDPVQVADAIFRRLVPPSNGSTQTERR